MKNTRFLVYVTILFFILSSHFVRIDAKKKKHRKIAPSSETPTPTGDSGSANTFSVKNYGAEGDGSTDDTDAFSKAWTDACNSENSVMLVPSGTYLVNQITFSGESCKSKMVFQVQGEILAPTIGKWKGGSSLAWLDFTKVNGLTIMGVGNAIINGMGEGWWEIKRDSKPTAIRVIGCDDVKVTGITIKDSQQAHLKFDNCNGVEATGITISSPADSANTDGIHIQGSTNVNINHNKISCGDDCISIQTGSSGIGISNVACGPSHGISMGGLGKDNTKACVSNVTVTDSTITNSQNGIRIKTWQGGSGSVRQLKFSNIEVSEVENAIFFDQNYCGGAHDCPYKSGNVAISDVIFDDIHGSFDLYSVNLACSQDVPCKDITLQDIRLTPSNGGNIAPSCSHAYGSMDSTITHCLKNTKSSSSSSYYKSSDNDGGYGNTDTC